MRRPTIRSLTPAATPTAIAPCREPLPSRLPSRGYYWLTFSANGGASDGKGPNIDDVKLTALGGPYSTAPSSGLTLIPSPAPASDTVYNNSNAFIGFHIVADPFSPPAAAQ